MERRAARSYISRSIRSIVYHVQHCTDSDSQTICRQLDTARADVLQHYLSKLCKASVIFKPRCSTTVYSDHPRSIVRMLSSQMDRQDVMPDSVNVVRTIPHAERILSSEFPTTDRLFHGVSDIATAHMEEQTARKYINLTPRRCRCRQMQGLPENI